jgi:hypothetical protein
VNIQVEGVEFKTARDAVRHAKASMSSRAIRIGGKNLVVDQSEADRLAASGVEFAFLCEHQMPDGSRRIMTVPVN